MNVTFAMGALIGILIGALTGTGALIKKKAPLNRARLAERERLLKEGR